MAKRLARQGGIRFMQGSLHDEAGRVFIEDDEYLDRAEAEDAALRSRVLAHRYHAPVEDITGDRGRIDDELADLQLEPVLFKTTATRYRDGTDAILVFERHH